MRNTGTRRSGRVAPRLKSILFVAGSLLVAARATAGEPASAAPAENALPKACAADSPVDRPCESWGGTYLVTLGPAAEGADRACVVSREVSAKFTLNGATVYEGKGSAHELDGLGKTLGMKKPDHRLGAALRKGVCCLDLELRDDAGPTRVVRIHLARGASVVSAEAHDSTGAKDCEGKPSVDVRLAK